MRAKTGSVGAKKARTESNSIDRLSLRLGNTRDLQTVSFVLLDWAIEMGLARAAILFLADESKVNLNATAWRGILSTEGSAEGLAESVCITLSESLAAEVGPLLRGATGSEEESLYVPLVVESELVGVVCAQRPTGARVAARNPNLGRGSSTRSRIDLKESSRLEEPNRLEESYRPTGALPAQRVLSTEEYRLWNAACGIAAPILRGIQRHQSLEQTTARLEEQKHTERLKDDLISTASHDLRSPVTSIRGYAQLAAKQLGKGDLERVDRCLEMIVKQVDQLNGLLDALLDVSRIQSGKLDLRCEEVNVVRLIDEIVERFSSTTDRHSFRVEAPSESVVGRWDGSKIGQAVANLVGNAIKYSPDGGEIGLGVQIGDGEVVIAISDQGIGIPPLELDRLFERFYRSQSALNRSLGGSGLGLYISQGVIKAHGGRIWVESEEGKGSTFYVGLPLT